MHALLSNFEAFAVMKFRIYKYILFVLKITTLARSGTGRKMCVLYLLTTFVRYA